MQVGKKLGETVLILSQTILRRSVASDLASKNQQDCAKLDGFGDELVRVEVGEEDAR